MSLTTKTVRGDKAKRLLLLMHGLGSNEQDLASLAPIIDPEGHFVTISPRGPYAYGPGFAWFKIDSPGLGGPTIASSLEAIDEVIDSAVAEYSVTRDEMVTGGFSMGGAMSLIHTFRSSPHPRPAGVLVMSGFLPPEGPVELDWSGELPPVLMQHGTRDPMVGIDRARATAELLKEHNVPLQFRTYPMEHSVIPDSARDAHDWLEQIRRGETPAPVEAELTEAAAPPDDGPVKAVTSATFDAEVLRSEKPVIVDFWAPWCGPCRAVAPIVEQIATMRQGAYKVVKLNIDEAPEIAQTYDVQSIPLIGLFRNGRMERKSLGAKPRQQLEAELGMLVIP
ncbi:MAG: thioredoxin [Actinomycetota bacterium]